MSEEAAVVDVPAPQSQPETQAAPTDKVEQNATGSAPADTTDATGEQKQDPNKGLRRFERRIDGLQRSLGQAQAQIEFERAERQRIESEYRKAIGHPEPDAKQAPDLKSIREQVKAEMRLESFSKRVETTLADKYDDYDIIFDPATPITEHMADVIDSSDIGPELAYHLASNRREAQRIAALSPAAQGRELTKLELKLQTEAKKPKPSSAPEPVKPVGSSPTPTPGLKEDMSMADFVVARRKGKA